METAVDGVDPKDYNESRIFMKEVFHLKSSLLCLDHTEYKSASVEYFLVYIL